jgi:E3 ubiquitin-protein ligase SHPRH
VLTKNLGSDSQEDEVKAMVNYLKSMPDNSSLDIDEERPAKRARTTSDLGSVSIVRHELSFVMYSSEAVDEPLHITRHDVGELIVVYRLWKPDRLHITLRRASKTAGFLVSHGIPENDIPISLEVCLYVEQHLSRDPGSEGCLWACLDVDLMQDGSRVDIKIAFDVRWNKSRDVSVESRSRPQQEMASFVLGNCFPELALAERSHAGVSPQNFYEAVHVPDKEAFDQSLLSAEIPNLTATLFAFQRRSLRWLLNREGVEWTKDTHSDTSILIPYESTQSSNPISFTEARDSAGQKFSLSPTFRVVATDVSPYFGLQTFRGGILAEEMGLGKTLEIIALMLLHRRPEEPRTVLDPYLGQHVRPTGATLIITPASLLDQWLSELSRHAPHLNVRYYPGFSASVKGDRTEQHVVDELASQDVVLTTYEVLRPEVHMALEPPERPTRGERVRRRLKSPLVQLSWWRVCVDEAQMVEDWKTNTATVARLIPRVNAWAITGTPVKGGVQNGKMIISCLV